MVLVSEVLEHIGRINLANMKSQKLKFIRNTAPDNQRVLNFMRNPYILYWCIFLFVTLGSTNIIQRVFLWTRYLLTLVRLVLINALKKIINSVCIIAFIENSSQQLGQAGHG